MEPFIIDTSVAIKWVFDENLSEKARGFLPLFESRKIELIVPEFFFSEFASVCWKKFRMKLASAAQAIRALDHVMNLSLTKYSDYELSDVALEHALLYKLSVYDGLYLALAEIYAAPLVTADKTLLRVCQGRFNWIESLQAISL